MITVICCKIGLDVSEDLEEKIGRWKFKSANWEAFKYITEVKFQELSINEEMEDVEKYNEKLCEVQYSTVQLKRLLGKVKGEKRKKSVPWTELCNKAIQARNKAFKKVRKTFIFDDFILYKKAQANVRRVIRDAKKNYWRNYCNSIGEEVAVSEVWCMIRKMGGFKRNFGIPVLNNGVKVHSNNNISEEMKINKV